MHYSPAWFTGKGVSGKDRDKGPHFRTPFVFCRSTLRQYCRSLPKFYFDSAHRQIHSQIAVDPTHSSKKKFKYLHTCNNKPNFNTKYAEFWSKLSIFNRKAYYENSIILHSATGQNWLASQEQVAAHILMKCFGSYSSIRFNLITDNGHSHTSIIET